MASRGKSLALSIAAGGLLVLCLGAIVLRQPLLEAWHIRRLQTGSIHQARRATAALGKMGSVNAVRALLAAPPRWQAEFAATTHATVWEPLDPSYFLGPAPSLPFPLAAAADQKDVLRAALPSEGTFVIADLTAHWAAGLEDGKQAQVSVVRWVCDAFDAIGDLALPALERAAADDRLDPAARAFARLQLSRRARASPRIARRRERAGLHRPAHLRAAPRLAGPRLPLGRRHGWGRRVPVWVTPTSGERLVDGRLLAEGEEVSFPLGGKRFVLRLEERRNRLLGIDRAVFQLREGEPVRLAR